ncbi:snoRNA-binding rRNA-processing protein utp10, partial [Spiromyces aspiralis]
MDLVEGPKNDGDGDSGGSRHAIELYLQRRAIDLLTTPLLKSLGGDHQRALVHRLLRILATQDHIHHGDAAVAKGIKGILDRLPLDPGLPAQDIEAFASELQALTDDSSRSAKKGRMEGGRSVAQRASNVVYKLVALLEFVQTKGTVSHSPLLALPLFTALSAMLDINVNHALGRPESDSQQPAPPLPIEYTKQLIIDILLHIFRETSRGGVKVDESMLRVDTLVQVIRTSTSPQTHNQSLLLLSAIAEQHPQLVLHHMMAIFTFMGANIFRQDDNYSFHVIQQAIEKIISPLVKSTSVTSDDTETDLDRASRQIRPVLEVFVDSLTHIPRHRRLILFATVVKTTGPRHFLYAMLGLLLEKQARRQSKPTAEDLLSSDAANSTSQPALEAGVKGRDDVADFALALAHQFSAADQLHALIQLQRDLLRLPAERQSKDQPDAYTEGLGLIDISHMSSRQLRAYRFLVLHFSNRLLTSAPFLSRLQEDADASNLVGDDVPPEQIPSVTNDRRFTELVESLLRVITSIGTLYAQLVAAAAAKNTHLSAPVEHAWKQILHEAYTTLGTTNNLLALPHFVATVNMLLAHENRTIRRKVLDLTNQRVASIGESGTRSKETVASILALLQPIQSLINDTSAAAAVETATNKQAALLCLTTLTRYFAAANPSEFVDIISTAIGPGGLGHANSQVVASAIVTLTHLVLELGPRAVPTLPKYMPIVLKHVSEGVLAYPTATSSQLTLLVGSLSALGAIAKKMASFVHPSLPALLSSLLHSNLNDSSAFKGGNKPLERRNVSDDAKLREHARAKVQAILATIAESVSPRHLLPAQFNYFQKEALKNGADSTVSLLNFVGLTASSMSRSTMSQFYKPMFKFFLIVFDTRRLHLSSNELAVDDIDQVEDAALDAFIKFVVKLSEKLFKPLFSSLVDWASAKLQGEDDDKDNEASSSDSPS